LSVGLPSIVTLNSPLYGPLYSTALVNSRRLLVRQVILILPEAGTAFSLAIIQLYEFFTASIIMLPKLLSFGIKLLPNGGTIGSKLFISVKVKALFWLVMS
jgi:hypothetical protein